MMMHLAHSTTVLTEFIAWLHILSYQLLTVFQVFHLLIWSKQASKWNTESWLTSERKFKIDGVHSQQIVTQLKKRWPVVCTWVSGVSDLCLRQDFDLWIQAVQSNCTWKNFSEYWWTLMCPTATHTCTTVITIQADKPYRLCVMQSDTWLCDEPQSL